MLLPGAGKGNPGRFQMIRHRINSAGIPRMTPQQTPHGQKAAPQ
jgi:hypothetical protein